jgi:two-component system, NtrC family, sensor kinase
MDNGGYSIIPTITTSTAPNSRNGSQHGSHRPNNELVGANAGSFRRSKSVVRLEEQHHKLELALMELRTAQTRLLQAQKLEAIGQLAAGIAHEINTPTQYVTDNVEFLSRAFDRLNEIVGACRGLITAVREGKPSEETLAEAEAAFAKARVDYMVAEVPKAIQQSLDGLHRVANIVAAMKDFSHPSDGEKNPIDLNEAIATTIVVATNEWKYVAEIETDFERDMPLVRCLRDEINQVVLNLIVNAAHAIDEVVLGGSEGLGKIRISTHLCDDNVVEIRVADTGCGIPEAARTRVFDPFFTTKAVGKGTGQGLSIAYSVVVDKHGGEIAFETESGKGTTFIVRLPITDEERPSTFFAPARS